MDKSYFIKNNYITNKPIENKVGKEIYWTKERIQRSHYYAQYYVYKFCKKLIKKKNLKSVLDIGCANAIKLMNLIYPVCQEVYGIDQRSIIDYCKKRYKLISFYSDDIEYSKLNLNKKFDLIISADVIEHLSNPNNLLSYIKKFCHKNTYIVLSTPERDILRGEECCFSPNKVHVREWNSLEFIKYLKFNNFKIFTHKIVKSRKINLNLRQPLLNIKKNIIEILKIFFRKKTIKNCQLVVCKLKN